MDRCDEVFTIDDVASIWRRVSTIVLCAPDNFPTYDALKDNEQMNLERAFHYLKKSVLEVAYPKADMTNTIHRNKVERLFGLLEKSKSEYQMGDDYNGAHTVQDFRDLLFVKRGAIRKLP